MSDPVDHPSHYSQGPIECIEAIQSALGLEGFKDFLRGQVIRYIWRGPHKENYMEDIKKARWYIERLITILNSQTSTCLEEKQLGKCDHDWKLVSADPAGNIYKCSQCSLVKCVKEETIPVTMPSNIYNSEDHTCTTTKGHYFKARGLWALDQRGNGSWDCKCIYCGLLRVKNYNTGEDTDIGYDKSNLTT